MTERPAGGIDEFLTRLCSCWEHRDLAGLASLWDRDHPQPTYVAEEVPGAIIGLEAIQTYWQSVFARFRDIEVVLRPLAHHVWNGQAWVLGTGGFRGTRIADGVRVVTDGVRVALLLRARGGVWRAIHYVEAPLRGT